jgi:hypothetical protein
MAYEGFKKLKQHLSKNSAIKNPGALAAAIGNAKFGKEKFQKHATAGTSLAHTAPKKGYKGLK